MLDKNNIKTLIILKITFLGTGTSQGVPVIACKCKTCQSYDHKDKRLRCSLLINVNNKNIIFDCGPDFRYQMLRENIDDISAVIFTHAHKDHTAGLDDIRAFNWVNNKPVDIYAEKLVHESLKMEFAYIFSDYKYPGIPEINSHTIKNEIFYIDDLKITPIRGMHYKLPVLGYRINDVSYITDFNFISEEEKEKLKGSKILIINALRKEKHISHFTLKEALKIIEEVKPEKAYLTHISHQMGKHEEIQKDIPENVEFAFDRLSITI